MAPRDNSDNPHHAYMTTLAAVLVRQRAVPLETVEQAMLRQSLFGGDLATNLLELDSSNEQTLLAATAATLDVEASPVGRVSPRSLDLLGAFTASELLDHPFFPVEDAGDHLVVAAATTLPATLEADIRARFQKGVKLRAALEIRIRQAIADRFGIALDERTVKLLARLDAGLSATVPLGRDEPAPRSSRAPRPRVSMPAIGRSLAPARSKSNKNAVPRRVGPFTPAMAEIELASAQSPGSVIAVWLDFVAQYFEYTAVFAVQGDIAAGKVARGPGTVGEAFARIGVPLDLPSALQRTRDAATWKLAALEPRGLDRTLARDLGRSAGPLVFLLPVCIKQRVVLLTYGDHGEEDVLLARVGDVLALEPLVERQLERLLVERKRGGRSLQPPVGRAGAEKRPSSISQAESRARALVDALGTTPGSSHGTSSEPTLGESVQEHPALPGTQDEGRATPSPGAVPSEPVRGTGELATGPSELATGHTPVAGNAQDVDTESIDESWDLIQPVLSVGEVDPTHTGRAATNNPRRDSSPPASVWPRAPKPVSILPKLELVRETDISADELAGGADLSLASATAAHPSGRPLASKVTPLQSHAVNDATEEQDRSCLELLERFQKGDADALQQLVEMGDLAASVLVRHLPGPIAMPSRAPRIEAVPKASDCGPLLKALVAFGPVARPYVIARTSDLDPKVRVWSIRLLGELKGRQSAMAVAERIVLDRDAEVRRAAYLSSHQLLREQDSALALRQALLGTAADQRSVITQRLAAIDALADLKDAPAIPSLIELLGDPNPGTAAAAQQALAVLARQDFGYDAKSWTSWWNVNQGRDRIEWVIDALDHRSPAIRQAASEELRLISRLYVGNFDDDSIEARAKMQKKYRDWWATGRGNSMPSGSGFGKA